VRDLVRGDGDVLGEPDTRKGTPSWTLSGGGPLIAREKHIAREKADMPWNVTRRMPASVATCCVNPRKKSETSASGGDGREARYATKGARSSAVARRNVGKSWCDGSASVDSTPASRSGCAMNGSANDADGSQEAAAREGDVGRGADHRDVEAAVTAPAARGDGRREVEERGSVWPLAMNGNTTMWSRAGTAAAAAMAMAIERAVARAREGAPPIFF
jgi:hypothetical protein